MIPTVLWRLGAGIAVLLLALGIGYKEGHKAGSEQVQAEWRKAQLKQKDADEKAAAASKQAEHDWNERLRKAQDEALKKTTALQNDLLATATANDSLQHQLSDTKRKLSAASADAVRHYSEALTDVFSQCVERYKEVARAADECDTTVNLLQEAWPQSTYISPETVSPIGK